MVRMNRLAIAAELLLSHQFSFGINGGVQQVILACNIALEINSSWVMLDLDSKNAHTFCPRERLEEELELNVTYRCMLESFKALYGKTATIQWHFGNGLDRPTTSFHMSCEGLRHGSALAIVYFDVLTSRVYKKQLRILDGSEGSLVRGGQLRETLGPVGGQSRVGKRLSGFGLGRSRPHHHDGEEPGLSAALRPSHAYRCRFLDDTPRNAQSELPAHAIPDGSERVDSFDPDSERVWEDENEVNILGTPLGTPAFVSSYPKGKGLKHLLLLRFIRDVASTGFPRETELVLKGAAVPRLSHILRSVHKISLSIGWMQEMDGAHLSAWLHYLTACEKLEHALGPEGRS
jgi:hypothetical protein